MNALRERAPSVHQRGLSLVELMVAMLVSLVLLGGVIQIYISSSQTNRLQEASSRLQENGRFAIEFISRDIRGAGYAGCRKLSDLPVNVLGNNPELQTAVEDNEIVWGNDGDSDVLRVRGGADASVNLDGDAEKGPANFKVEPNPGWKQGHKVLIADCERADVFTLVNNPENSQGKITLTHSQELSKEYEEEHAQVMSFGEIAYYVGASSVDESVGALYRDDGDEAELLRGIENLQITYGLDSDDDGNVDEYVDASPGTAWEEVLAVRVEMLFASEEPNLLAEPQPYYFAGQTVDDAAAIGDRRLRRVFATTVTLRNRAP